MENKKLFSYVDNVELSPRMKESLISGEVTFSKVSYSNWKGFMPLAGMMAVLCIALIGGYVFLVGNDIPPPPPQVDPVITTTPEQTPPPPHTDPPNHPAPFPTINFRTIPEGVHQYQIPFDWRFGSTDGAKNILNLYEALSCHAEYENYKPNFTPYYQWDEITGYFSYEKLAVEIRAFADGVDVPAYTETFNENAWLFLNFSLEEYCLDFIKRIGAPDEFIPESFMVYGTEVTREDIRETEIRSTKLALLLARAFTYGDTDYISQQFQTIIQEYDESTDKWNVYNNPIFDFVKATKFGEFRMTKSEYDPETYEFLHYFTIEDNGGDLSSPFLGERYWVLRTDGYQISQFLPADAELNRIQRSNNLSDLVNFCYTYSVYYGFQTEFYRRGSAHYWGLLYALTMLYDYEDYDEYGGGYFTVERYIELAEYVFGIQTTREELEEQGAINEEGTHVILWARGGSPTRCVLVSEDWRNDGIVEIVLNFYGDMGYLYLAKTVRYELVAGQYGWRLGSTEVIYENPDIDVLFVSY